MKKFFKKLAIFALPLVVLNIVFFIYIEKTYVNKYKRPDLSYDKFLIADSHGEYMGPSLEKYGIFNFSYSSDSYFDMKRKVKYLLAENKNLKAIYITADDHTLSQYRERSDNRARSLVFTGQEDFDSNYDYFIQKYLSRYIVFFNPNHAEYLFAMAKAEIYKIVKKDEVKMARMKNWALLSEDKRIANSVKRMHTQFDAPAASKTLNNDLIDIVKMCRERNVEVIGIKYPLSGDFLDVVDDKSYGAANLLDSLGVKVHDYKHVFKDRDDYFSDQDHVNGNGAKAFAQKLMESK